MTNPLATAAAEYLGRGLTVIALTGKTPNVTVHRHGLHDFIAGAPESPEDWELLEAAFGHPDTTGIAIIIPFPYVVVDVDGEQGAEQWQSDFAADLPDRWVAKTPRLPEGGLHMWFSCATPTGSIKLGPKLDLKGQNSYVAVAPSLHPDGGTYEWLVAPGDEPPIEVPPQLQKLIDYHVAQTARRIAGKAQRKTIPVTATFGGVTYLSVPSFEGVIRSVAEAAEGNRNNALHWAAATMAEEGAHEEDFEKLAEAALAVGLEREETRRTIRSAARLA